MKTFLVQALAPTNEQECERAEKWAYDRLTDARNSVKHKRGTRDTHFMYDSEQEARNVIDRAVTTFLQVNLQLDRRLVSLFAAFDRATHGAGES